MKNLKKLSALAISLMMVLSFAGCESSDDSSKKDSSSMTETTTTTSAPESSSDADSESSSNTETGLKDGIYTTEDYSIELGDDWEETNSSSGMVVFQPSNDTVTTINILEQSTGSQKIDIDQLKEQAIEQFKEKDDCKVTDSEDTKIGGFDACLVYLEVKILSVNGKAIQAYIATDSNLFIFTFATSEDKYDEFEPKVQKMLESFKVL